MFEMGESIIEVATSFDSRVELAAVVMISSLRRHTNPARKIRCHLIADGLSSVAESIFERMQSDNMEIILYHVRNEFNGLQARDYITVGSYLRFYIPKYLTGYDKVLYLDVDLIARSDIAPLFDIDLGPHPLAAMPDHSLNASALTRQPWRFSHEGKDVKFSDYCHDVLNVATQGASPYFNAGVMVLSLAKWRELNIAERSIAFLQTKPDLRFIDQDALNHVVGVDYRPIDARWNSCAFHTFKLKIKLLDRWDIRVWRWHAIRGQWRDEPWIIHFAGPDKPWWPTAETSFLDHYWWEEARYCSEYPLIRDTFLQELASSDFVIDKSAQ